jgi:hypothetical protein
MHIQPLRPQLQRVLHDRSDHTAHEQTGVRYAECFGVRLTRYRHAASGQQLAPRPCVFACAVRYAFADVAVCYWTVVRKAKGVKYVQSAFARYQPIFIMNSDPKSIILEQQLIAFFTDMGIQTSVKRVAVVLRAAFTTIRAQPRLSPLLMLLPPLPQSCPAGHTFPPQRHDETCLLKVRRRFAPDFKSQKR